MVGRRVSADVPWLRSAARAFGAARVLVRVVLTSGTTHEPPSRALIEPC